MILNIALTKRETVCVALLLVVGLFTCTPGTLRVHHVIPPFPRSLKGKFHILFAHLRQLHLTAHLLSSGAPTYDVYFVDQLSTCVPFLRLLGLTRVVFYCHFPDKLLANGAFVEGNLVKRKTNFLTWLYRQPMDWLEEVTTSRLSHLIYDE
jgi:alpha-1,3/alpha-1,6-mannosyltransferase